MTHVTESGFFAAAIGTEAPLEMLSACHGHIALQCETLERLAIYLDAHGVDKDVAAAAARIMRYFDTTAADHHADEEEDLFPAMIESMAGSDAVCLQELMAGLAADHRTLEAVWRRLRAALEVVAKGQLVRSIASDVETLVTLYKHHIAREERELLPMAARLLSEDDLAAVGRAMRKRRGIAAV